MANLPTSFEGEQQSWPRSEWVDGQFFGVRRLIVGWDDRADMITYLATPPNDQWPYPEGPSDAWLRRVKVEPLSDIRGGGAQTSASTNWIAAYDKAVLECHYSTRGPVYFGGKLYDEWLVPTFEHIRVNPEYLEWSGGAELDEGDAFGRLICGFDYIIKYYRVPTIPAWVLNYVGYVNSNVVPSISLDLSFPVGTLQYKYPTLSRSVTLGKLSGWDITVRYGYRGQTWWKHWRTATGQFEAVYKRSDTSQYYNYPGVSMTL